LGARFGTRTILACDAAQAKRGWLASRRKILPQRRSTRELAKNIAAETLRKTKEKTKKQKN
jgi:hypothetical protein